jgi:hypothetical protein
MIVIWQGQSAMPSDSSPAQHEVALMPRQYSFVECNLSPRAEYRDLTPDSMSLDLFDYCHDNSTRLDRRVPPPTDSDTREPHIVPLVSGREAVPVLATQTYWIVQYGN